MSPQPNSTPDEWGARLLQGDCLEMMRTLDAESIDALVSDPPYGLEFMGKEWDSFGPGAPGGAGFSKLGFDTREDARAVPTFGKGLEAMRAFQVWTEEWAAEAMRILKPGAHLLAFGGTRTYHRLTAGLEEAGFEIRDSLHWIYGSGFPKSLDVAKQIDKGAGHWRGRAGEITGQSGSLAGPHYERTEKGDPITAEAQAWDGWGTALKPAHEPIVLARKPFTGSVTKNVLANGTGAINIRGAEVGTTGGTKQVVAKAAASGDEVTTYGASIGSAPGGNVEDGGRWPSNVLLAHLADCQGTGPEHTEVLCAPGCPVAEINDADEMATPARFFYIAKPRTRERVGGTIRNLHPTVKPIDLMRYLMRLVTPPGGVVLDPFMGSGTTGCGAMVEGFRFVGIERDEESFDTARARISDYAFAKGRPRPDCGRPEAEITSAD